MGVAKVAYSLSVAVGGITILSQCEWRAAVQ